MNLQGIKNRIRKILAYTIAGVLFFFISAFLVLQIPPVQQYLVNRYVGDFGNVVGFKTEIKSFRMLWFDHLELKDVRVHDPDSNLMIGARSILINFKLSQLIGGPDVNIDGITVDGAEVNLTKITEYDTARRLNINVFIDRINEQFASDSPRPKKRTQRIKIGEAVVMESQFSYVNQDADSVEKGFNYNQFRVLIDEGQLDHFLVLGDTTEFNVKTLIAQDEYTKFKIHELSTFYRLSQGGMEFTGLNMRAGESVVSDTILFSYNRHTDLEDFNSKVRIHANLENTTVYPQDLALFAPFTERLGTEPIKLKGKFNGRVNRFRFTEMEIDKGQTSLRGVIEMEGLPDYTETFMNLNLRQSHIFFDDLSFVFNDNTLQRLKPLGKLLMNGQFIGYTNDFVAKGDFVSRIGNIRSDINFKVNETNFDLSNYSGNISLGGFDLGRYLDDTVSYQKVNLSGKVAGRGLTRKTADFTLNGKVNSIGVFGYDYTNITTNARLSSEFFSGTVRINDPNLECNISGSVDLRRGRNILNVQGVLDTAFLHNLHFSDKHLFLHSKIDLNLNGWHLDSLDGTAHLQDFKINYGDEWLELDNIDLEALKQQDGGRTVNLKSTTVDATFKGVFNPTDVANDIKTLYREIVLNLENDKNKLAAYYQNKKERPKRYGIDFEFLLKDINPITKLIDLDLHLSDNTLIQGKFSSGYTSIFQAFTKVDSLMYQRNLLVNTDVELTASKIADSTSVLANFFVNSASQRFGNLQTSNLITEGIWNDNHVDFSFDADEAREKNYVRLLGAIDFLRDSTEIHFKPSTVHLLEKQWDFDPTNKVVIGGSDIRVSHLALRNENQSIRINGRISEDPAEILTANINQFNLSALNAFIEEKISGELNAQIDLSNYYADPVVQNDIDLKALTIENFLIGDITAKNLWDTVENKFNINLYVDRQQQRIINASGYYNPSSEGNPINIDAKFSEANVNIIEPFLNDYFSHWDGLISGDFHMTGNLRNPILNGEGQVKNGQLMINYLKTIYKFTGTVGVSPNSIFFRNMALHDAFNNQATLSGSITHEGFRNMRINLDADYKNFQVLNTTAKDNELFYGQGYASGDLNIFGPLSNLKFTANAKTDKNTRIYIPIGGTSSTDKKEFISFINFSDSTFQESLKKSLPKQRALSGITIDFNLDVTPDAYGEIILDMKAGDIISGRGNGDLQLQLDTKGEFRMFGPFEFTQGRYNFTLYDIINKDFEIKKGSRITWYGDPYRGILATNASYNQLASFGPILTDQTLSATPQMRRKYPVEVLLKLEGPMLSPQLTFDIVANGLPQSVIVDGQTVRLAFEFQTFKNKMDEQELNRQVFSLIILRRFSPPDAFNTGGSIVNSVSEFLSNQLSNWVTQVDENLEIDVDLGMMDQETFNTFQLRLSYSFFNGRLRVTRDGTFYSNQSSATTAATNQSNLSGLAGDWTVDYMLTADGKFRAKMYNRTNVNPILNTQNNMTTGASVMYTQSFNEFKDLIRRAREKRIRRAQQKDEEQKLQDEAGRNKDARKEEDGGE